MLAARKNSGQDKKFRSVNDRYRALAVVAALAIASAGCGGGGSTSMNGPMSAAQAEAVSGQVVQALTAALENTFGTTLPSERRPSLSGVMANAHADTSSSSGCSTTASGESCNFPVSYSGACSGGGTISVNGDISGNLNSSDTGSIAAQITIDPSGCVVSGTTFSGDPDIMVMGQVAFTDANVTFPLTFSETGGISYGPNPSGSCQLNVTYTINSLSSCTVTGTVCGQSVAGSC